MKKKVIITVSVFLLSVNLVMANQYGYYDNYQNNFEKMYNIQQQQLQIQKQQQMQQMNQTQQMTPEMEKEYLRGMCYQNCNAKYGYNNNPSVMTMVSICAAQCDPKYK